MNIDVAHFSRPILLLIFAGAAAAIWVAGIYLSNATDVLSKRLGLGHALGGLVLLAIVANLPEIAIIVSAVLHYNLGIAMGNILVGIALQTVVLVVLDAVGLGKADSLTYRAASLELDRLEGPRPPKRVVIDPRETETAKQADVHLSPRLGTNVPVMNGLLNLIIQAGQVNTAYIRAHTVGYQELVDTVAPWTPEKVAQVSGGPGVFLKTEPRGRHSRWAFRRAGP